VASKARLQPFLLNWFLFQGRMRSSNRLYCKNRKDYQQKIYMWTPESWRSKVCGVKSAIATFSFESIPFSRENAKQQSTLLQESQRITNRKFICELQSREEVKYVASKARLQPFLLNRVLLSSNQLNCKNRKESPTENLFANSRVAKK
jgi:hypothetical protein